jgi:hypothetical protein
MHTSIAKTKAGWQGNTRIDLGDGRILRITTAKALDGSLCTTGLVHHVKQENGYRAEVHHARKDYGRRMVHWNVRATEKQVRGQHELALDMVDDMLPAIAKHYGG